MSVRVYVEGGGDGRELGARCREGFSAFFDKAGLTGRMPRIVACGGRQKTYDKFCSALTNAADNEFIVLLVDSEDPVAEGADPWAHLKNRDNWDSPAGAADDNAHLMAQCMEAWFFADKDSLAKYFGAGFNRKALSGQKDIENIPKADLENHLQAATRQCEPKGEYRKGRHSFAVLAALDPAKVAAAAPHAKRLVNILRNKASAP